MFSSRLQIGHTTRPFFVSSLRIGGVAVKSFDVPGTIFSVIPPKDIHIPETEKLKAFFSFLPSARPGLWPALQLRRVLGENINYIIK